LGPSWAVPTPTLAACRTCFRVPCSRYSVCMNTLPHDLSEFDSEGLERARDVRERRLTPLFRRWPVLSAIETGELRRLYEERIRLARYIGSLRNSEHGP
jgi:hypothetical protein